MRDFLLKDNDCLLLHADRDVQVGLDSRSYAQICSTNRAEQEALFRIPILGATTCNNGTHLSMLRPDLSASQKLRGTWNKWMNN